MKVPNRPVIEEINTELLSVTFEFEGESHPVYFHGYGSMRQFHASRNFLRTKDASDAEQMIAYNSYIGSLVDGWDERSNEFFGGEFSGKLVEKICQNPKNAWFVSAIIQELDKHTKK